MAASAPVGSSTPRSLIRLRILVRGAVQGVGFRPFVHRRASAMGLTGWVSNSTEGVTVEAQGGPAQVATLVAAIRDTPPGNAAVTSIETRELAPCHEVGFVIRGSETAGGRSAEILPDLATCAECLRELFDPRDRRYLYPFINCTHCGPRFSIVEDIPYDRSRTSMRHFPMCETCRAEYDDPADRRFHAEPNACPSCGPRLALWGTAGEVLARDHAALLAAAAALRRGQIVAVKGIGGFHLMVDATDEAAVVRLRRRKRREEKPFAVMFPALGQIGASCEVGALEEALLVTPARPIVLLRRKLGTVAFSVTPGNPWLGVFLPYAPVHHLLMRELGSPVIATSGNLSDEPIVTDAGAAVARLAGVADLFLVHDRPIVRPVDDSVVRVVCGRELMLRRARGFAPRSVKVANIPPDILAFGGHLKATLAITRPGGVVLSQHLGDLETVAAREAHANAVKDAAELFAAVPRRVVRDLHPDYASTRAAETMGVPVIAVQHHLAHVVACMAEHGLAPPLLGVAWDGAGYGPDGTVWGGEFLQVTQAGWRRVAHLRRFRLPGGEIAAREPRRSALGLLYEAFGESALAMTDLTPIGAFTDTERAVLGRMLERGTNAPWCSSIGRLFDSFAALCGLRQISSYEGQAAAALEWAADGYNAGPGCKFTIIETAGPLLLDWQWALERALVELRAGTAAGAVAAALHKGLAAAIVAVAERVRERRVLLTGGCFQNARLTEEAVAALRGAGFEPVWHRQVPPNDGGIALGQAVWAGWCEQAGGM